MLTTYDYALLESEVRRRSRLKQGYLDYLNHVEPTYDWTQPHHALIAKTCDDILDQKIQKVMFLCPARHGKSAMVTVRLPVRWLERYPDRNVIVVGHTQTLADGFSGESRRLANRRYIRINKRCDRIAEWQTEQGGAYRCFGINGGITGKGAPLIIIDDPIKNAEQAHSKIYRDKIWKAYAMDIRSRREPPHNAIILIQTRWHEDDLAGRILASDEAKEWTVISLPAIAEEGDMLGRDVGEPLWADRYSLDFLERERALFPTEFNALYQQRPTAADGDIFRVDTINYYTDHPPLDGYHILAVDTAFGELEGNDYSVIQHWMFSAHRYYLLDCMRGHWSYDTLRQNCQDKVRQVKPQHIVIEHAGSGISLSADLRRAGMPVVDVRPMHDKVARAHCVTHLFDTGKIWLPKDVAWRADYVDELATFPAAKHDDMVDTTVYGLRYLCDRFGYQLPQVNPLRTANIVQSWRF